MKSRNWIFLRGLTRGHGHWGLFADQFRERFPNDEVEFLDLPGCGSRNFELSPLSIKANLSGVREKSQFISQGKKVHLLSISLGGMVAALWQDFHPEEIISITLINSSFQEMPPWKRFNFKKFPRMMSILFASTTDEKENQISQLICNNEEARKKNLKLLIEFSKKYPVQKQNLFRQLFAASRVQFPRNLKRPCLILGSNLDQLVSVECSIQLSRYWGCPLELHSQAGHDLPIDDPKWLLDQLEKYTKVE